MFVSAMGSSTTAFDACSGPRFMRARTSAPPIATPSANRNRFPMDPISSTDERDQDDDGDGHSQEPQQYRAHARLRYCLTDESRSRPPKVAANAAMNAPTNSDTTSHSASAADALRASSAA